MIFIFSSDSNPNLLLGDSYNDYDFLSITDISIIIRNKGRTLKPVENRWIISKKYGVEGWAEEVRKIINP